MGHIYLDDIFQDIEGDKNVIKNLVKSRQLGRTAENSY
jgi:hypothetical protein